MQRIRSTRPEIRALRAGTAVLAFTAATAGLASAPAAAAPARPDLAVTVSPDPARLPTGGQVVGVGVGLVNQGRAVADGVTLTFQFPDGVSPAGEGGIPSDSPWRCVLSVPVTTCTHPALAAGEAAAPLKLRITLPGGPDGTSVTVPVAASTSSRETATGNNAANAVFTYDASIVIPEPHGSDLRFVSLDTRPYWVVAGDRVRNVFEFENAGDQVAEDVVLRVTLDPNLRPEPAESATFPWQCVTLADGWECRHEPMAPGERDLIGFDSTVTGGVAGDLLKVEGLLSTSTPELNDSNGIWNHLEYADTSTVHGRLWLDTDVDGQRDADEPAVDPTTGNVSVQLVPTFEANGPAISVPVNADGTYSVEAKPDEYVVEVRVAVGAYDFTVTDQGDDAADSDIYRYTTEGEERVGRSSATYLYNGTELVVDTGLVRAAA
ncbi:hypothetical protein NCC78_07890 [Micromonospora phytophila]|uniref:SdrD B-like domain-containing protein n=1 Tax=Micromonospora phytophila TaxID=709888 RepID=UPI00202FECA7|nr:SdrD B-like domain-containing protein [Micromonospora phytophila]MCM0674606.1 hypothetical protein [Micromonospora phytophila]